ncbi:hypothetical protein T190130A13A_100098 [Tenacibaculum sp. 190130A14a]|uniref:Uncharacterized protein n=1 Tax=Tenacibaculum polynesiense TaxID=3137857 RepID=A0ABM9P6D8_9FLAO
MKKEKLKTEAATSVLFFISKLVSLLREKSLQPLNQKVTLPCIKLK